MVVNLNVTDESESALCPDITDPVTVRYCVGPADTFLYADDSRSCAFHGCTHLLMFSGMACSRTLCTAVHHADIGKSVVLCLERKKSTSMSVGKNVYIFPLGHSNLKERKLLLDPYLTW